MHRSVGAIWWKWDLHVHTPASIANNQYGGDTGEAWEAFLSDLANLPEEVKVLGINDYLFLDGYRRVVEAKVTGRLPNIELILPVVELRIDKFGGTEGKLSRVNFHAIFSDALSPDVIETQFIRSLDVEARLTPTATADRPTFSGVVSKESLEDFGREIIASVPEQERDRFHAPLVEGFNGLNFTLESVRKALRRTYFERKVLTAVGKTEWWGIKWNEQSVADKKDIINGVDFVFIAAESPEHCRKAYDDLTRSGVNNRLLDCSDAHSLASAAVKDRVGNSLTWLCADTEFEGLRQVRKEPEDRIFLGGEPPQRKQVREAPRRFLRSVKIEPVERSSGERGWFDDVSIDLNPSLVAIIGRKGSGKSALADSLGLLGRTDRMEHASFLNKHRFRAGGLAEQFKGTLMWHSGDQTEMGLHEDPARGVVPEVNYIPQDFFEEVCNELIGRAEGRFDAELRDVIFSWVPDDERLGATTLRDLLDHHVEEVQKSIHRLRGNLAGINAKVVALLSALKPEAQGELKRLLNMKRDEVRAQNADRPGEVARPEVAPSAEEPAGELTELVQAVEDAERRITEAKERRGTLVDHLSKARRLEGRLKNLDETVRTFAEESAADLEGLGLKLEDIVEFSANYAPIEATIENLSGEKALLDKALNEDEASQGDLIAKASKAQGDLDEARERLEGPRRAYEQYLEALRQWEKRREELIGAPDKPETLRGLAARCRKVNQLPQELEALREQRTRIVREIPFIGDILEALYTDHSRPGKIGRRIEDQLKDGETVEDLLYFLFGLEYLVPRYTLRLGDKPIEQLSPGEKGALLLVFYLLVDRSDAPLIIDQPEGNLDNETVFDLLVPSIRTAKKRRQVIMVTHNPNLAVVCDAEQIVVAHRQTEPVVKIDYAGGAIEDPAIKTSVIAILEGTEPAFLNRERKYLR